MPAAPFRRSFAVVIGIDHYGDGVPSLRTAVNDARRLGELLGTEHGYDVTSLLDGDATGARITALLTTELPAQVQADDRVLFYFAGHGVAFDGDEGPNGYLLPADATAGHEDTFLRMPMVHDALLALPCRHMLVVLDSCFSGAFRWSGTRDMAPAPQVVHKEKYDRFVRDPAWQVLTSASQDQKALDSLSALGSRGADGQHSPFATALFAAMAGESDVIPKGVGDGLVTVSELYVFVEDTLETAVAAVGRTQTARLWPLRKHGKGEFVFFVPGRELTLPPAPELTFERNPWSGLTSYDGRTASLFFGRDAEIAALRTAIAAQPLTVVLGSSGSGKSSLVNAGVVPRLALDGWHVLPGMRPGTAPLAALAQALSPADGAAVPATPEAITQRVAALVQQHAAAKVLLVIDQFEELVTLADGPAERTQMLALLAQLVEAHPDAFRLVVTIRTDFEPNFDSTPFGERWAAGRFIVPAMSRESLRDVIEKPAAARVLYFEPTQLVERLLDEVAATPGALPLLSFALSEMYIEFVKRRSADRAITTADYDVVGGVAGALRSRAEKEFGALNAAEQATLRRVMMRMVSGEGAGIARRRVTDAELDFVDADERARAATVISRFTAGRLLVEGREPTGEKFVEPAHDALVRGWGQLQEWLNAEQRAPFSLQQQQRLSRAAQEWDRAEPRERDGQLWRDGPRSAQLATLVRDRAPWLTTRERAFAARSIRGRNIARATAAAAVLLIVAGGVAATIAGLRASRRAEEVRIASIVRSAQAAVTDDPLLATQLLGSIDSAMVSQLDDGTRLSLIGTTLQLNSAPQVEWTFGDGPAIERAKIGADGEWMVDADDDGFVYLRDLSRRSSYMVPLAFASTFGDAAFDAGNTMAAIGTTDGEVLLQCLRTPTGMPRKIWMRGGDAIASVHLNRTGTRLITIDSSHLARVVSVPHPCEPGGDTEVTPLLELPGTHSADFIIGDGVAATDLTGRVVLTSADGRKRRTVDVSNGSPYTTLAVSADGRQLALGAADGSLRVATVGQTIRPSVLLQDDSVMSLAFSADGSTLVSAHATSGVHRWNTTDGSHQQFRDTDEDPHDRISIDPSGRYAIGVSLFNPHVTLFDDTGRPHRLSGQKSDVIAASVSHGGQRMVTVARDGGIWIWKPAQPALYHGTPPTNAAQGKGATITAIAFSPDSRQVMLASRDGSLFRAPVETGRVAEPFARDTSTIRAMQWGADENSLHTLTSTGQRIHWRFTENRITKRVAVTPARDVLVNGLRTTDGRRVLSLTVAGEAALWDITSDAAPLRTQVFDSTTVCRMEGDPDTDQDDQFCLPVSRACVALSATGTRMAHCAGAEFVVRELTAKKPPLTFATGSSARVPVALSPDGRQLAGGAEDFVLLWNVDDPKADARELRIGGDTVFQLAYSPDGQLLAAYSSDARIRVVDLRTGLTIVTVRPRSAIIDALQFTPDSRHILAYGFGSREARAWNVRGTSAALSVPTDGLAVQALEFSPDGRWMVVADNDETARLVPLDANLALTPFRPVRECLPAELRERYLSETAAVARQRAARCTPPARRATVPVASTTP